MPALSNSRRVPIKPSLCEAHSCITLAQRRGGTGACSLQSTSVTQIADFVLTLSLGSATLKAD